jgi:hypothetical protein
LAGILVGTIADRVRVAPRLVEQARSFDFDGRHQALFIERLLHDVIGLAKEPLLLGDDPSRALELVGGGAPQPIDDVGEAMLIDDDLAAERDPPRVGECFLEFI